MKKSDYRVAAYVLTLLVVLAAILYERDALLQPMQKAKSSFQHKLISRHNFSDYPQPSTTSPKPFDPNTADSATLLSLGLPRWMVMGMYKYRAKGGVYQTPEDVARIPGMTVGMYKRLKPYIIIGDDYKSAAELVGPKKYSHTVLQQSRDTFPHQQKLTQNERINLNTADTSLLKKVPGIGSYYAKKIVDLRTKYGGFTSLSQVLQIKGLPEDALEYMTLPDGNIQKININTASFKRMAQHPYIGYKRTKTIFDYRRLKGKITNLQQLSLLPGFSKEERKLMEEYIVY